MSEYSFLSKEQIETSKALKEKGRGAEITDFSFLLGGELRIYSFNEDKRCGHYWTQTEYDNSSSYFYDACGKIMTQATKRRAIGIRPIIPISYIKDNYPDIQANEEGFIEFGNYPQTAVNSELQKELEQLFIEEKLDKTGDTYTTDSQSIYAGISISDDTSFKPKVHEEFEYNGSRYVRVEANDNRSRHLSASNGEKYEKGDNVWVKVEPVRWMMDEQLGYFISEKILVAGIQYQEQKKFRELIEKDEDNIDEIYREMVRARFMGVDFDKSHIKYFMDEFLSKDIEQSMIRTKEVELASPDGNYQASDMESYTTEGVPAYDKIGDMYQRHLTNEKEMKENENEK